METVIKRGQSRSRGRKGRGIKENRNSHFRTVCSGGFEEEEVLCYLWDTVKTMEPGRLEQQMRRRIRMEMRCYFVRCKRRNMRLWAFVFLFLCAVWLFDDQIGIDQVSGTSMYPYLNHGDWIVYNRRGREIRRDDVVVFEMNGETMVKRVAGLPGDQVEFNRSGSRVLVNGAQEPEEYVTLARPEYGDTKEEERMSAIQTVMNGQYLVLGDNRAESLDSRDRKIGTVPSEAILGRVVWIVRRGS